MSGYKLRTGHLQKTSENRIVLFPANCSVSTNQNKQLITHCEKISHSV